MGIARLIMNRPQYYTHNFVLMMVLLSAMVSMKALGQQTLQAKPHKIEIEKPILATILTDYIAEARKNGAFYEDMGVIRLTVCFSKPENTTRYTLAVLIDNRYEDQPIEKYAYFENYVILFDSCRSNISIPNKDEYFRSLNEEIGDRVYKRPTKKGRWMTYRTKEGKLESGMRELSIIRGGSGQQNGRVYIVDENNKFKKLKPV